MTGRGPALESSGGSPGDGLWPKETDDTKCRPSFYAVDNRLWKAVFVRYGLPPGVRQRLRPAVSGLFFELG
jgi:hypothetical protein